MDMLVLKLKKTIKRTETTTELVVQSADLPHIGGSFTAIVSKKERPTSAKRRIPLEPKGIRHAELYPLLD